MKRNRPLNEEKKKAILKAAIAEFYDKGFDGSSMDTISKEANVSKATVYNHFKNKEELFLAIAFLLKERFTSLFHYNYSKEKSLETQLAEMAKKEMDLLCVQENITLIQIVTVVMLQQNDVGKKLTENMKEENICMAQTWFEAAKEEGKLHFEDASYVAREFIGYIKSFAFFPQLYGAPLLTKKEQERVINAAIKMILTLYKV